MYVPTAYESFYSYVKHHSEVHIIKNNVMEQSKGPNGYLMPEHKKTK